MGYRLSWQPEVTIYSASIIPTFGRYSVVYSKRETSKFDWVPKRLVSNVIPIMVMMVCSCVV